MALTRRLFLGGMLVGTAAPAIVSSVMPLWVPPAQVFRFKGPITAGPWSEQLARKFYDSTVFGENLNRAYFEEAHLACNPPLIVGELGQIDRFTLHLSTFSGLKPWR